MRLRRFELPRDYLPLGPQPSASANSATAACCWVSQLQKRNYEEKHGLVNSGSFIFGYAAFCFLRRHSLSRFIAVTVKCPPPDSHDTTTPRHCKTQTQLKYDAFSITEFWQSLPLPSWSFLHALLCPVFLKAYRMAIGKPPRSDRLLWKNNPPPLEN